MSEDKIDLSNCTQVPIEMIRELRRKFVFYDNFMVFLIFTIGVVWWLSERELIQLSDNQTFSNPYFRELDSGFVGSLICINYIVLIGIWILGAWKTSPLHNLINRIAKNEFHQHYILSLIFMSTITFFIFILFVKTFFSNLSMMTGILFINIMYMGGIRNHTLKFLSLEKFKASQLMRFVTSNFILNLLIPILAYILIRSDPLFFNFGRHYFDEYPDYPIGLILSIVIVFTLISILFVHYTNSPILYKLSNDMTEIRPGIEDFPEIMKGYSTMPGVTFVEALTFIIYQTDSNITTFSIFMVLSVIVSILIFFRIHSSLKKSINDGQAIESTT